MASDQSARLLLEKLLWALENEAKAAAARHDETHDKLDALIAEVRKLQAEDARGAILSRLDTLVPEVARTVPRLAVEARQAVDALAGEVLDRTGPVRRDLTPMPGPVTAPHQVAQPPAAPAAAKPAAGDAPEEVVDVTKFVYRHRGTIFKGLAWAATAVLTGTGALAALQRGCGKWPAGSAAIDAAQPLGEAAEPAGGLQVAKGEPQPQPKKPQPPPPPPPPAKGKRKSRPVQDAANDKEVVPGGHVAIPLHDTDCNGLKGPDQKSKCKVVEDALGEPTDDLRGSERRK